MTKSKKIGRNAWWFIPRHHLLWWIRTIDRCTGGCRCRQCARRVPRVLEFAIADDVKNQHLDYGARRALVGLLEKAGVIKNSRCCLWKFVKVYLKDWVKGRRRLKFIRCRTCVGEAWCCHWTFSKEMVLNDDVFCKESEVCFHSHEVDAAYGNWRG